MDREADDRIVDDRLVRTEARIQHTEPPRDGITGEQARRLAAKLIEAADALAGATQS